MTRRELHSVIFPSIRTFFEQLMNENPSHTNLEDLPVATGLSISLSSLWTSYDCVGITAKTTKKPLLSLAQGTGYLLGEEQQIFSLYSYRIVARHCLGRDSYDFMNRVLENFLPGLWKYGYPELHGGQTVLYNRHGQPIIIRSTTRFTNSHDISTIDCLSPRVLTNLDHDVRPFAFLTTPCDHRTNRPIIPLRYKAVIAPSVEETVEGTFDVDNGV